MKALEQGRLHEKLQVVPHGRHFMLAYRQNRANLEDQGVGLQAADELCVYDEAFMDPFEGKSPKPRL